MRRAVVTGLGVIAPNGQSAGDFFAAVVGGQSGITLLSPAVMSAPNSFVAGQVAFDPCQRWRPNELSQIDRSTQFALVAADQALADASLDLTEEESLGVARLLGHGTRRRDRRSRIATVDCSLRHACACARRPSCLGMNNAAAAQISMAYGLRGPLLNFSTACSSSATSIGEAARAIRHGYADVIVAGGSEALLTYGNVLAWDAMRALAHADPGDPSRSCKPFAANRTGLVLGEGAAALVLESQRARRATRREHLRRARWIRQCVGRA